MPAGLRIEAGGQVMLREAKRHVPPVQWKYSDVQKWLATAHNGAFSEVVAPNSLDGRALVRMTPLSLARFFAGDTKQGQKLYDAIHDHVSAVAKAIENQRKGLA